MFFTRLGVSSSELEVMIYAIDLEYKYVGDDELAVLIAKNYDLSLEAVKSTLQAYRASKGEDYEMQSKRFEYARN